MLFLLISTTDQQGGWFSLFEGIACKRYGDLHSKPIGTYTLGLYFPNGHEILTQLRGVVEVDKYVASLMLIAESKSALSPEAI